MLGEKLEKKKREELSSVVLFPEVVGSSIFIRLSIGYLYTPTSLVRKIFQSKIELGGGGEGKQKNTEKNFLNYS